MPVSFVLPFGPKNLASLFPGVDFSEVEEYSLQVIDQADDSTVLTTPAFKRGCCCADDTMRLFFVNYLGGIDSINLNRPLEELETVSSSWKKPLQYPHAKWDGGKQRINVTSNETVTAENSCFEEDDQEWLKELLGSPNCWVQWTGTQSQSDDYIPVVIKDGKFITRKVDERYNYVLQVVFEYANENIIPRN